MSKLIISPSLNEQEFKEISQLMEGYTLRLTCTCEWDTLDDNQWSHFAIKTIKNCDSCKEKYQKIVTDFLQGIPSFHDHTVLYYVQKHISPLYPEHNFIGYNAGCEQVGVRFDKYIIKNGKEIGSYSVYLKKFDWNENYEDQFEGYGVKDP